MTKHKIQNNIKAQIQNGKTFVLEFDIWIYFDIWILSFVISSRRLCGKIEWAGDGICVSFFYPHYLLFLLLLLTLTLVHWIPLPMTPSHNWGGGTTLPTKVWERALKIPIHINVIRAHSCDVSLDLIESLLQFNRLRFGPRNRFPVLAHTIRKRVIGTLGIDWGILP